MPETSEKGQGANLPGPSHVWGRVWGIDVPAVMGIVNVTPDSFSDGGDALDADAAVARGLEMARAGAAIVDVGGESTRPGAEPVPAATEQSRVLPVVAALARAGLCVSIDTRNASTMARALDAGAAIVNDVSALGHDADSAGVVARAGCRVVLMHMRGTPATMAGLSGYGDDLPGEVAAELLVRLHDALDAGVSPERIALDPGIGFAKTREGNVALLAGLRRIAALGYPLVVGVSRKGFLGALSGARDRRARGPASIAAGLFALDRGAHVLRVHDVAETVQAVRVWRALHGCATLPG